MNARNLIITVVVLLTLLSIFVVGCSKQTNVNEQEKDTLNYDFQVTDFKNINKILSEQKYAYYTDSNRKYIAVIIYESGKAVLKQYLIEKDTELDFTISKNSVIIMSFPTNKTDDFAWDVKSNTNNGIIKFDHVDSFSIPIPNTQKNSTYNRENFFLKSQALGNEKIVMRYAQLPDKKPPNDVERNELLKVIFNIKVE